MKRMVKQILLSKLVQDHCSVMIVMMIISVVMIMMMMIYYH